MRPSRQKPETENRGNQKSDELVSISRLAALLGRDRETVREQLATIEPAGAVVVRGQRAQAYALSTLPTSIGERLTESAAAQGFRDLSRFISHAKARWAPSLPVGKLPHAQVEAARSRCSVLAPVLAECADQPIAEIVRQAVPAWKGQGRHPVTERTLRRWIERAMSRDRDFSDWSRWEIYLDDDVTPVAATAQPDVARELNLPHLEEAIAAVAVPACPTSEERERIWHQANKDADILEEGGAQATAVQRAILLALELSALPLAKTPAALRKAYTRKRASWIEGGRRRSALADGRTQANRDRSFTLPADDKFTLLRLALKAGGDLAPAWRQAVASRLLSAGTLIRFQDEPADKSHVPHSIRRAISRDLLQLVQRNQGPRSARLSGTYTDRDWSAVDPGDWWVGDDLTPPVYFWDEEASSQQPMRGQLLMLCDAKTDYVLGWVLLSARNYNARCIRSLITRCHDSHGLPREGFLFENGIWKQSRILTGQKSDKDAVSMEDTESGLSEFGCRFTHATTPGQKTIERVFGLLQDRMEDVPGYCGRDERRDCPEKTRSQLLAVQSGRVHPSKYFYEKKAWMDVISEIVATHNAERRSARAKRIPGQSPAEVYEGRRTDDIVHLGEHGRHLLSSHRVPVTVTKQGIKLRDSLGGGCYRNQHTGELIGQTVLAWIDVDAPEAITITTLDRQNPRLVERAHQPRALGAESWELRSAVESRRSHMGYGDALYRVVTGGRGRMFRPLVLDRAAAHLGAEMQRQKDAAAAKRRETAALSQQFDRISGKVGIDIAKPESPDRLRDLVKGMAAGAEHWREVEKRAQEDIEL